mmetsp:Transcript_3666/g.4173  ORF Transcript_3666/g.4173 Transcript_3666/m.4173 type:complete len:238 (-) Transcript_3666:21-734(-)
MYHRAPADRAMFTRCSTHKNVLREGFDVQTLNIPRPVMMNQSVATEKNETFLQRPLLVSFKGSRTAYVRDRLVKLNNSKDVVILVKGYPQYDSWDYMNLQLKSRFCLAPRGFGLHSYRMAEVMAVGCIPVVISDGYAFPEPSVTNPPVNWDEVAVRVDEDGLDTLVEFLRRMPNDEVLRRHWAVRDAYIKLFAAGGLHPVGGIPVIVRRVVSLVQRRWPSNASNLNATIYQANSTVL